MFSVVPQTAQVPVVVTNQVTQTNIVVQTNIVTQTLTNGVTQTNTVFTTNTVLQTVPVLVTNTVTVTNGYVVSSAASNVLAVAGAANTLTGPVDPFSGSIALGLTALSAGLGWYARLKTKQAQAHLSVAQTVITAVEGLEPAVAAGVNSAVAAQSAKMGTSAAVNQVVNAVTQNLS